MSYNLLYSQRARGQLASLPHDLVDAFDRNTLALAQTPVTLSVPVASPPYPPRGQLYHFLAEDSAGAVWFFTFIFRYSQDETALHLVALNWRELVDE